MPDIAINENNFLAYILFGYGIVHEIQIKIGKKLNIIAECQLLVRLINEHEILITIRYA